MSKSIYYNYSEVLSHKAILNFIVGPRGNGKTYGAKKLVFKKFFKNGEEFVYIRRSKESLEEAKKKFMTDIILEVSTWKEYGKEAEIYTYGDTLYYRESEESKPIPIAYFIPLSCYEKYKSSSYHRVTTVIYDEFLSKENYLKDEVWKFNDLFETIFRDRPNARALLIANSLSISNPFFDTFGIKQGKGIVKKTLAFEGQKMTIICDFCQSPEYIENKKKTPSGLLSQATGYGAYSMDSEFVLDDNRNVFEKVEGNLEARYNLILEDLKIGVYMVNGCYFFGNPIPDARTYCKTAEESAKYAAMVIPNNWATLKYMVSSFKRDACLYKNITIKNAIVLFMRNIVRKY